MQSPSKAMDEAVAALTAQAAHTASGLIEARAAKYALRPILLETIERGLSGLPPGRFAARVAQLIDCELAQPRRHMGFGGEVPLANLRAAAMYAARLCAIAERGI